jgi:glycosyltransferase involved in cell wall biosynthesis
MSGSEIVLAPDGLARAGDRALELGDLLGLLPLKGKVALIVPTFNSAPTIAETLESILAQGSALELLHGVLIADGGSDDRTREIAKQIWRSPVPLEVRIMGTRRGEARDVTDAAFSLPPNVEWFFLMHSDNVAKSNWLATILGELISVEEDVASVCSSYDAWAPGVKLELGEEVPGAPMELIAGDRAAMRGTLLRGCWWHHSTSAIRLAALREVGGYLPQFRQYLDWELLLRLLEAGWSIGYVRRSLMKYREHAGSLSTGNIQRHLDIWESLAVVRKFQHALSVRDLVQFHGIRARHLATRIVTSCMRGQMDRLLHALHAATYLPVSVAACLKDRSLGLAVRRGAVDDE